MVILVVCRWDLVVLSSVCSVVFWWYFMGFEFFRGGRFSVVLYWLLVAKKCVFSGFSEFLRACLVSLGKQKALKVFKNMKTLFYRETEGLTN